MYRDQPRQDWNFQPPAAPPNPAPYRYPGHHAARAAHAAAKREAVLANKAFEAHIAGLQHHYGKRVVFTPVCDAAGTVYGYAIASARDVKKKARGEVCTLLVAGKHEISREIPRLGHGWPVDVMRTDAPIATAYGLRHGQVPPLQQAPGRGGQPNYLIDADRVSPAEAALFASSAGRSRRNGLPIETFVPAPHASVHVSTLLRLLQGQHGRIAVTLP